MKCEAKKFCSSIMRHHRKQCWHRHGLLKRFSVYKSHKELLSSLETPMRSRQRSLLFYKQHCVLPWKQHQKQTQNSTCTLLLTIFLTNNCSFGSKILYFFLSLFVGYKCIAIIWLPISVLLKETRFFHQNRNTNIIFESNKWRLWGWEMSFIH